MRALFGVIALGLAVGGGASGARATTEHAVVHMVGPGETLASIAELYYGDPHRESVLVAENGLTTEGGSAIVVGLRLVIPTVSYHKVQEGETWATLATKFYGDPSRAFVLIEANGGVVGEHPDPGAELVIPFPLRHVAAQTDSLRKIAKVYYRSQQNTGVTTIRRFNDIKKNRLLRGQILLIPLSTLVLTDKGKELAKQNGTPAPSGGEVRDKQAHIDEQLPALRDHVRLGRYADAVAMANRLIGGGDLAGSQIVTIHRELAEALVALGREDLAVDAFAKVLDQQPDTELDGVSTSPKVLMAFARAQKAADKSDKTRSSRRDAKRRGKKKKSPSR